jgi:hypothetical protein
MLLSPEEQEGIRDGRITLGFRCWDRPRVRPGTRMRTGVGLVEVLAVDPVELDEITEEEAGLAGAGSQEELVGRLRPWLHKGAVYRVGLRWAGPDPRIVLRNSSELSEGELADLVRRLEGMDRPDPWTRAVLEVIERQPATRAAELARQFGRETLPFKRDVRKLKELGLTESLEVGYRLSPRGSALLEAIRKDAQAG